MSVVAPAWISAKRREKNLHSPLWSFIVNLPWELLPEFIYRGQKMERYCGFLHMVDSELRVRAFS